MNTRSILAAGVLACASWPAVACYTVYDADNRVMYRGEQAPVDMSRPLHETVPRRFPGGQMVFDASSCTALPVSLPSRRLPPAPLLTERHTAQEIGARYAVLSRDIVMVPPAQADVALTALPAGINVIVGGHSSAMGAAGRQWTPDDRRPARPARVHPGARR